MARQSSKHRRSLVPKRKTPISKGGKRLNSLRRVFLTAIVAEPHEIPKELEEGLLEASQMQRLGWVRKARTIGELRRAFNRRSDAELAAGFSETSLKGPLNREGFEIMRFLVKRIYGKKIAAGVFGKEALGRVPDKEEDLPVHLRIALARVRRETVPRRKGFMETFFEAVEKEIRQSAKTTKTASL